jgi:integrase
MWAWPVDTKGYDRTPSLNCGELAALDSWVSQREREHGSHIPQRVKATLHRLVCPLSDVLDVTGADTAIRRGTIRFLVHAMLRRQTTFWAWSSDEWVETLIAKGSQMTSSEFQRLHHISNACRQHAIAIAYLLCEFKELHRLGALYRGSLAKKLFGERLIDLAVQRVLDVVTQWGYKEHHMQRFLPNTIHEILLVNRHPHLETVTRETLEFVYHHTVPSHLQNDVILISRALVTLGVITRPLEPNCIADARYGERGAAEGVAEEWISWCQRWRETSTQAAHSREGIYYNLLKAGHWLAEQHPEVTSPAQWTRDLTIAYVAAVDRMVIGQWVPKRNFRPELAGKPLSPRSKSHLLGAISVFFRDCQEWGWIPRRFDPRRCFATPRAIRSLIGPDPRVIADDIWAKLLWAGLNLTADDLPRGVYRRGANGACSTELRASYYPVEMVRAMVMVWLFTGLRKNEFSRLRIGCIRWQREDVTVPWTGEILPKDAVCFLDVPTNKTGTAFTKPVDRCVGEAIATWERVRPVQPAAVDTKTGEVVQYLFSYRSRRISADYINRTIIPVLCRRAGVPEQDARGPITSHRARSTIASQLFNAKNPFSLFELQEWLGHRSPVSTQQYAKIAPTKLAKSYADAGYFERNVRTVEVLIDQDVVKSGAAVTGEPWRFYDLGHGYCTYDFFDQCPHRMACAKCAFYRPKGSSQAQILEAKANLLRMKQDIPLSEEEQAAIDDGLAALEKLCEQLADIPTPSGPTPRELGNGGKRVLPMVQQLSKFSES